MKTAEIISLHPGRQHNLEQAEQLIKYFDSFKHVTSFVVSHGALKKDGFLPKPILKDMQKRSVGDKLASHTDLFPWYEVIYKFKRIFNKSLPYDNFFLNRSHYIQKKFLNNYTPPKIFIGFDNSSELIFKQWKGKSILVLDLTIAIPQYKKKLAETYRLPESTIKNLTNLDDIWYKTFENEVTLADYILCGSEFVKASCMYLGVPEEKLIVIPYGANLKKFTPNILPAERKETPFKIAFVGNVAYRKGADVLLNAWKQINSKYDSVELHFYGNVQIDVTKYDLKNVFFHGFIVHDELIKQLSESHISILPTFFEGSSYAIYQSMALGLAVVTTPNCGSIVSHMNNGVIIDYGSEEQIVNAVSMLIDDQELRVKLSNKAMVDVKDYSWENYGVKLKNFICSIKN